MHSAVVTRGINFLPAELVGGGLAGVQGTLRDSPLFIVCIVMDGAGCCLSRKGRAVK